MGWPVMTHKEIRVLKNILLLVPRNQTITIFEYGSGFSTIYFAKFLRKAGRPFLIHSLDNNRFWYEKVTAMVEAAKLKDRVFLHLREFTPFWEKPNWDWNAAPQKDIFAPHTQAEKEYVNFPQTLATSFNVVFVDGRFRRRCLEDLQKYIDPQCIIVMHDAQKKQYHTATASFRHSRFIDSGKYFPFARRKYLLWIGSPQNPLVELIAAESA